MPIRNSVTKLLQRLKKYSTLTGDVIMGNQHSELLLPVAKKPETPLPIVYHPGYNISFLGLEKLHPFDSQKWGRTHTMLKNAGLLTDSTTVQPTEATREDLLVSHSERYLKLLTHSSQVARITEIPPVAFLPSWLVDRQVLRPLRFHVGGSILAGQLALEKGYAINLGGGFHHCSAKKDDGGGFCAYADITLLIQHLRNLGKAERVMIVDLDAHQGNGHENDFLGDENTFIFDIYGSGNYPYDRPARKAIKRDLGMQSGMDDSTLLEALEAHLESDIDSFKPDLLVYNAGTDILDGDPLGGMKISRKGIVLRDEKVFRACRTRNLPVVFLTSGGYQHITAAVIAESILNLYDKDLLNVI